MKAGTKGLEYPRVSVEKHCVLCAGATGVYVLSARVRKGYGQNVVECRDNSVGVGGCRSICGGGDIRSG